MKPTESSFEKLLAEWQVAPVRDPQFRDQVWDRIAGRSARVNWSSYWRGHAVAMTVAFAAASVLGAVTGREKALARAEAETGRLATAYVRGLDARTMRMP